MAWLFVARSIEKRRIPMAFLTCLSGALRQFHRQLGYHISWRRVKYARRTLQSGRRANALAESSNVALGRYHEPGWEDRPRHSRIPAERNSTRLIRPTTWVSIPSDFAVASAQACDAARCSEYQAWGRNAARKPSSVADTCVSGEADMSIFGTLIETAKLFAAFLSRMFFSSCGRERGRSAAQGTARMDPVLLLTPPFDQRLRLQRRAEDNPWPATRPAARR